MLRPIGFFSLILAGVVFIHSEHATAQSASKDDSMFGLILSRFDSIDLTTIVDRMKAEGKNQQKFGATFGVKGTLIRLKEFESPEEEGGERMDLDFIPFAVRLTTDGKVYVSTSALRFKNLFRQFLQPDDRDMTSERAALEQTDLLVFKFDDGVNFRDVRSFSFKVLDTEIALPVAGNVKSMKYLAIVAGGHLGKESQQIRLEDGRTLELRGSKYSSNAFGPQEEPASMGVAWGVAGGIQVKEALKSGVVIDLKGIISTDQIKGGVYDKDLYSAALPDLREDIRYGAHMIQTYVSPTLSISKPIGKKSSQRVELVASGKIPVRHTLNGEPYSLDLKDRNRNLYNVTVRLRF